MKEEKTVYIIGAGFNQCVKNWDGLKPPMASNFFQTILKSKKYQNEHYSEHVHLVYEYIKKYWKKTKKDLINQPFNLEECFTLLDSQYKEAEKIGDKHLATELMIINFRLEAMLAEFFSEFEMFSYKSDLLRAFGEQIYKEKPTVITFNYDCILENIIESASGVCEKIPDTYRGAPNEDGNVPNKELPYSHCNWNRPLGYGIKFNEVQLQRAGLSTYVDGRRFYSHPENNLYDWKILKLHGSLNWFQYLPIRSFPSLLNKEKFSPKKLNDIILVNGHWWFGRPPDRNGWIIVPSIITPTLYKDEFYQEKLFSNLWSQAKSQLAQCTRLVVIGYSFSPTDFAIRKLLLEAFVNNDLTDLIIVNRNDKVEEIVKGLTHFSKPVSRYRDVKDYFKIF